MPSWQHPDHQRSEALFVPWIRVDDRVRGTLIPEHSVSIQWSDVCGDGKGPPAMRNAHPSADIPAEIPKPAFLTADHHAHHQQAEQGGDRAYETVPHLIHNSR